VRIHSGAILAAPVGLYLIFNCQKSRDAEHPRAGRMDMPAPMKSLAWGFASELVSC